MGPKLTEADFVPLAQCQFQHWCDRAGPPYSSIRPLNESAAERVWARAAALRAAASERLDLSTLDDWGPPLVTRWLLSRVPDADQHVFVCYQPRVVVSVPWGVVCGHWLVFFWTGACVYASDGTWKLVHDGDRFDHFVAGAPQPAACD